MKIYKLFPFALAAMAFASCSNEEENGQNPNAKSEIVDVMTVSFTNNGTYAKTGDEVAGVDTENNIYHAFVFARESAPQRVGAQLGEYTVVEVGTSESTEAINVTGGEPVASFKGVTVGEDVFVIANDPKMKLEDARKLAYQGLKSAAAIKAYKMELDKSYLGSLTIAKGEKPTAKFIMTGSAKVPDNKEPAEGDKLPSVECEIGLNREVAKVDFTAQVTKITTAEAFGNVEIKPTDGIVVVRMPRVAVPFSSLEIADYFPATAAPTDFDWDVDGKNVEKATWIAFDGEKKRTPADDGTFNKIPFQTTVKEYRYTWVGDEVTPANSPLKITGVGAAALLTSPTFYVTPNYSGLNSSKTIVVTQATITKDILDPAITKEILGELAAEGGTVEKPWTDNKVATAELTALFTKITGYTEQGTNEDIKKLQATYTGKTALDLLAYKKDQKTFYAADIADYANTDKSDNITKRNHFYQMTGTITTMGSATIKDAVSEKNVDMTVTVKVNPWTVVINNINM